MAEVARAAVQQRAQLLGALAGERPRRRLVGARGAFAAARSSPRALKACRASSTVWSSQPSCSAIRGARSPRALASRIWQRRKTKASVERRPARQRLPLGVRDGRTKIGGLMPASIPHSRLPSLIMH